MKDIYSYIEFKFSDRERFNTLQTIFYKLKEVKDSFSNLDLPDKENEIDYEDPVDQHPWKEYLDQEAIAYFENTFDYNSFEGIIYWLLWELTEPEIRLHHPFFKTPGNWHFESMLDAIFNGYYMLIDLKQEQSDRGCLYYQPTAYPFGGCDSLVELIKSFGGRITYNSQYKQMKPVIESSWDYELAKKLVKQGIGFTPELLHN